MHLLRVPQTYSKIDIHLLQPVYNPIVDCIGTRLKGLLLIVPQWQFAEAPETSFKLLTSEICKKCCKHLVLLTTCTCSLVSVKQEQVRVFCYSNKKLTGLQQSNFSIFGRHQTEFARCQFESKCSLAEIALIKITFISYFMKISRRKFSLQNAHTFFALFTQ